MRILQLSRENLYPMLFKEGYTLFRSTGYGGNSKDGSDGGSDKIGIIKVCQRVAHNYSRGIGGICTTEDSSEITGFLDALQNNKKGIPIDSPTLLAK